MKALRIGSILCILFLSFGNGSGQSLKESSDNLIEHTEMIKILENSIEALRSEVRTLKEKIDSLSFRRPLWSYKLPKEVYLCGEKIPLEDRQIWENLDREFIVTLDSEAQVLLWMKRARRYFPYIEQRLKEMNLPEDLKYVAITESGLRPHAVSSSGAAGIWQFIPSTGEKYGLKREIGLDERFDFFKATEGALTYLKTLYEEFQSWTLAMAAYNTGENRIRREIEFQKTKNYFYLDLPMETKRYVYKIAVAKIILSNPEKFGFSLEKDEFYDPITVERVQIELPEPLPLIEVAKAIGRYFKEMKELNPHFSGEVIPIGTHFINLPPGTAEKFKIFFLSWRNGLE
ncbi:MAG: lytic transglycosylase domain-containing protein [Thermodesulfobacteriota bacterium]